MVGILSLVMGICSLFIAWRMIKVSSRRAFTKSQWVLACRPSDSPKQQLTEHRIIEGLGAVARHAAEDAALAQFVTPEHGLGGLRSLSENPIWLRAACFATGLRPAVSTIYTDIACFAVLASRKTARSRADDGILRYAPLRLI